MRYLFVIFSLFAIFSCPSYGVSISYGDNGGTNGAARACVGSLTPVFIDLPNQGYYLKWNYSWSGSANPATPYSYRRMVRGSWVNGGAWVGLSGTSSTSPTFIEAPLYEGDCVEFKRGATSYKPAEEILSFSIYRQGPLHLLTFTATNGGSSEKWYGVYSSAGDFFGIQMVAPGATYLYQLAVDPEDDLNYTLATADIKAYAYSGDNPAGSGYLNVEQTKDGSNILPIPDRYVSPIGSPQNYNTSSTIASSSSESARAARGGNVNVVKSSPTSTDSTGNVVGVGGTGTGSGNLTEGTAGAGFAEVNANLKAIKAAIIAQGGGGGGSTDVSGVETRLDTANVTLDAINQRGSDMVAEGGDIRAAAGGKTAYQMNEEFDTAAQQGSAAATDLQQSVSVASIVNVVNASSVNTSSAGSVSLTTAVSGPILVGGFGGSLDLSPTQSNGVQARLGIDWSWFLGWVRNFIAATSVLWFLKEAVDGAKEACMALGATPQHQVGGSTQIVLSANVLGNSVGVVPAGVMWGAAVIAVTASVIAAPTIIAAGVYAFANVSGVISSGSSAIGALASAATGAGASGVFTKVFDLANAVCPIGLLIVIACNRVLLSIGVLVQYVALHVGIKIMGML